MSIAAHIKAINSLADSLDEDLKLQRDGDTVSFRLGSDEFTINLDGDYPNGGGLLFCLTSENVDLEAINNNLSSRCSLSRALTQLGEALGTDLSWVQEATGDGGDESMRGGDDSDGDGDDDEMGVDAALQDGPDDDTLREWSRRIGTWEKIDREIEEAEKNEDGMNNNKDIDALQKRQIFDTRAAFFLLVNEMEVIFKKQDVNILADADGPSGIYTWTVNLAGFSPESDLAKDLQIAGRKHGVSSIQLQLLFKRGLHPFYPPSVRVVSPRLKSPMFEALACYPLFRLDRWDPMLSAENVLLELKDFLEKNARLDLEHFNLGHGVPAHSEVEQLMVRLQALTRVDPLLDAIIFPSDGNLEKAKSPSSEPVTKRPRSDAAQQQQQEGLTTNVLHDDDDEEDVIDEDEQPLPKGKSKAVVWNSGVGYGTGRGASSKGDVWDAARSEAVQRARDAEACEVLQNLARELIASLTSPDAPREKEMAIGALRRGCLVPLVIRELASASFQNMVDRHTYYMAILKCVDAMVCVPEVSDVVTIPAKNDSTRTVASVVAAVRSQALYFNKVYKNAAPSAASGAASGAGSSRAAAAGTRATGGPTSVAAAQLAAASLTSNEDTWEEELAAYLLRVADKLAPIAQKAPTAAGFAVARTHTRAGDNAALDEEHRYANIMAPYRVRIAAEVAKNHSFSNDSKAEMYPNKARAKRVARELASCESDTPLSTSSSVFVAADEANTILWKVLITGPKGTPYAGGCFLFDVYFPADYPNRAPKVKLRTTGGGIVRFNPNLYDCGKVCLSLLGTWNGSSEETWNAAYSTILQVLVSIQSLILVDEPYYNEPGYEQRQDQARSDSYSANIMEQTVRWAMIDMLRSPPESFADVIKAHFKERGDAILETVRGWVEWCTSKNCARNAAKIREMLPQLETELARLKD